VPFFTAKAFVLGKEISKQKSYRSETGVATIEFQKISRLGAQ
jgi:hypothetical protein